MEKAAIALASRSFFSRIACRTSKTRCWPPSRLRANGCGNAGGRGRDDGHGHGCDRGHGHGHGRGDGH